MNGIKHFKIIVVLICILSSPAMAARVQDAFDVLSVADLYETGHRCFQSGDFQRAKTFLAATAARYDDDMTTEEKRVCVDCMVSLGYLEYFEYHRYDESFSWLTQAADIARREGLEGCLARAYLNLGNLYQGSMLTSSEPQLSSLALSFYSKAFDIAERIGDQALLVKSFLNLTSLDVLFPNFTPINRELAVVEHSEFPDTIIFSRYAKVLAKAVRALQRHDYRQAQALYEALPQYSDDTINPEYSKAGALDMAARICMLEGNYNKAFSLYHDILEIGRGYGLPEVELECLGKISEIYRHQGEDGKADDFRFMYLEKKDSLLRVHQTGTIPQLHYASLFDDEIRLRTSTESKLLTTRIVTVAVCVLLVVVIVLVYVLIRKNRLLTSKNDELYRKNTELLRVEDTIINTEKVNPLKGAAINADHIDALESRIENVLASSDFICSPDASLKTLAEKVGSNTSYVSYILNNKYSENFSILLGNLRIKEICRRIEREPQRYRQLTVEAISAEAGFKSRSTFRTSFVRQTGLTPSDYIRRSCAH